MAGPKQFLVYSPPYWKGSAGIFALHRLANNLGQLGFDVTMSFYNLGRVSLSQEDLDSRPLNFFNPDDYYNLLARTKPTPKPGELKDFIVIYPETLPGNPLNAPNVVRYVMNFPAKNMHPMVAGENDFILAYWPEYYPGFHHTLAILPENPHLKLSSSVTPLLERSMHCCYIGKGVKLPGYFDLEATMAITREWPASKPELYALLRKTRLFFTWDSNSLLNFEAVFWGALPVFLRFQPYFDSFSKMGLAPFPYATAQPVLKTRSFEKLRLHFQDFDVERQQAIDRYQALRQDELFLTMAFAEKAQAHFLH
jgi:hypothetical protein